MSPRPRCLPALLGLLAVLAACTGGPGPPATDPGQGPAQLHWAGRGEVLHLVGEVRGAFPGIGPTVSLEAWLRDDGRARLSLRSKDEDDRPTHEILLWGPESCLLFEARSGRFTDLGAGDGRLEALGNAFGLADATFLTCGRDPVRPGVAGTELLGTAVDFRGVRESGTLRRVGDVASLRWQAEDGTIHYLQASYEDYLETNWGPWPARIEVTGSDLETAARLHWTLVDPIVVLGDSIFDPLWEPASR